MPASRQAAARTDVYRRAIKLLRNQAAARAAGAWSRVTADDIDASFAQASATLVPSLTQMQRAAVRLTNAYVTAYVADELGRPRRLQVPTAERWAGGSRVQGKDLSSILVAAPIAAKVLIGNGEEPTKALRRAGAGITRTAGEEVMFPARGALEHTVKEDDSLMGFRRVAGPSACAACLASMTGAVQSEEPLEVHDHCTCTGEPVVRGVRETVVRPTGEDIVSGMTPEQLSAQFGQQTAQALKEGTIELRDLVGHVHNVAMADGITQAPLTAA